MSANLFIDISEFFLCDASMLTALDEDWEVLRGFFPEHWRELAQREGALKGLRQDKDAELLLRTLLLHVGAGHSLRETALRASAAGWAQLSDVALLKRLRKSEPWLLALCQGLFAERELAPGRTGSRRLRLIDSTEVKEPGKTGSLWRVHYSVELPSLRCSHFELTSAKGPGSGDSLVRFTSSAQEHILADRGYCAARGIDHLASQGAAVTVRLVPRCVRLRTRQGEPLDLPGALRSLAHGQVLELPVVVQDRHDQHAVTGRICARLKSELATQQAMKKLHQRASKHGTRIEEQTRFYARYILVFTTTQAEELDAEAVLQLYRLRWQVELVFKRFKQLAHLGCLPKRDPASARAWLYGKLFVALLTEKIIAHAASFSPWGY